jgi:uncharacterized protein (DUF169 family)
MHRSGRPQPDPLTIPKENLVEVKNTDLAIFGEFGFSRPPVGVKFLFDKPEGVERLDKQLRLCAMLPEAQMADSPFYVDKDNEGCGYAGSWVLGWGDIPRSCAAGGLATVDGTFQEARANRRLYDYLPRLEPGTINYLMFAPLSRLSFDPDLLLVMTDSDSQTEILLRAMSYSTGKPWVSRITGVMGCAWIYVYPYKTGEINYMNTGVFYGPKRYRHFPPDKQIVAIPFDWLPTVVRSLTDMTWVLPEYL